MHIELLRYIAEIAKTGSINKAAKNLYISQPQLSRKLKELEQISNIIIFQRTSKGVELTQDGAKFMEHASRLLEEYESIEKKFFLGEPGDTVTLKVANQRYSPLLNAFLLFYKNYCLGKKYMNLAIYEDNLESIISLVSEQIYNVGVIHILRSDENDLMNMLQMNKLKYILLDDERIYAQMNSNHPLAGQSTVTLEELSAYPCVTFADECVSNINYCCDVQKYNKEVMKKRIIVQSRGTCQSILSMTDAYYLGLKLMYGSNTSPSDLISVLLADSTDHIRTYWIYKEDPMTEYEQALLDTFRQMQMEAKNAEASAIG